METLSRVGCLTNCTHFPFPTSSPIYPPQSHSTRLPSLSVLRTPRPVGELAGEDVLRMFFKERELNGDFISKASDMLWQREVMKFVDAEAGTPPDTPQQPEGVKEIEYEGGFLKLTRTQEWVLGDNSAPINKKAIAKVLQDDSERRKRLNLLKYEALKREILLLSVGIGTACSGYCLIVLSAQAAISYAAGVLFRYHYVTLLKHVNKRDGNMFATGMNEYHIMVSQSAVIHRLMDAGTVVRENHLIFYQHLHDLFASGLFSCLYLQLLYQHADNLSKEAVPQIFMKKKSKKIGIRSQDLEDLLEKTIKGSGIALSSPRLVIPAAIYGLWILSQHFAGDFFDFQLVPAMFGMFAYKAAALVQVYRDNEDLQFVFPDNEEGSID